MNSAAHNELPERVIGNIGDQFGQTLQLDRHLSGGENGGAWLLHTGDSTPIVVKLLTDPSRVDRTLRAVPAITRAVDGGWPTARWLQTGTLSDGTFFVLQEYLTGQHVTELDETTASAVVTANDRQRGLADPDAYDHTAHHDAVLSGDGPWKDAVARHSSAGADLVAHGDQVLKVTGRPSLPRSDVVHGDYSRPNMLITSPGTVQFVDAETIGRGSRVRDLADLYRHGYVYGHTTAQGLATLRSAAASATGPDVFVACVVAATYNNLAWWVTNRTRIQFDQACGYLGTLFNALVTDTS